MKPKKEKKVKPKWCVISRSELMNLVLAQKPPKRA